MWVRSAMLAESLTFVFVAMLRGDLYVAGTIIGHILVVLGHKKRSRDVL